MRSLFIALAALSLVVMGVSGCGGGGDGGNAAPAGMIGAAGGTVSGPSGAKVVIPAGALASDTAIAISLAPSSAALPEGNASVGPVFAFTPHGQTFLLPVTITVPVDPAQMPAGATVRLHKTMNGAAGPWQEVAGATLAGNLLSGQVTSFSDVVPTVGMTTPGDQAVVAPAAATFTVNAIGGTPPFTYEWERSDDGGMTFAPAPGATSSNTYTTGPTSLAGDNGDRYRVRITSSDTDGNGVRDGTATSRIATLTVTTVVVAPAITTQPASQTVAAGANATFSVVATGTDLVYQWLKNGVPIAGQTNASLSLINVQAADVASYSVNVSNLVAGNPVNSISSNAATLALSAPGTLNLTGTWITNFTCTGSGGNFSGTETLTVTQTGTAVSFTTQPDGGTFTGTLTGNTMSYSGSAPGYTESGVWTMQGPNSFTKTSTYVNTRRHRRQLPRDRSTPVGPEPPRRTSWVHACRRASSPPPSRWRSCAPAAAAVAAEARSILPPSRSRK